MFKGIKSLVAGVATAGVLAGAGAAQAADYVGLDLTGSGSYQAIESLDLNRGNSLSVNGVTAGVGESFDVYFQSRISAVNLSTGNELDLGGYYLTVVVKFSEKKVSEGPLLDPISMTPIPNTSFASFTEGDGSDEYFEIWLTPSQTSDDLAGTGFGADSGGTKILWGNEINVQSGFFYIANNTQTQDFDQSPDGDDYSDFQTIIGSGTTVLTAGGLEALDGYFSGLNAGDTISLVLANPASNATPFDAVNPAQQFWDGSGYIDPQLGFINGVGGPDFQFQTNGNLTFEVTNTPVIPEPATAALGLIGLAGLAMASRRRR